MKNSDNKLMSFDGFYPVRHRTKKPDSQKLDEWMLNNPVPEIIKDYIHDARLGINLSSKKRPKDYSIWILVMSIFRQNKKILSLYNKNLWELNQEEMHSYWLTLNKEYNSPQNIKKEIITFWNWRVRKLRREGIDIKNPCIDLSQDKKNESNFVYFTFEELKSVLTEFNWVEQTLLIFLFDAFPRPPHEVTSIKRENLTLENNELMVYIPKSKTFSRRFNLIFSKEIINEYLKLMKLEPDEMLFPFFGYRFQKKIIKKVRKAFIKKFGNRMTAGGKPFSELTLYSFRHNGAIHFRNKKYPIDQILYRGGWTNMEMLNYYTKRLGTQMGVIEEKDSLSEMKKEIERLSSIVTNLADKIEVQKIPRPSIRSGLF